MPVPSLSRLSEWGLTSLALHFEGEDLTHERQPFAGVLLVQLRMDVQADADPELVRQVDLEVVKTAAPGLRLLSGGKLEGREHLEWTVPDKLHGALQSLVIYVKLGRRLYTVTGTHKQERFSKIRGDILAFAAQLQSEVTS